MASRNRDNEQPRFKNREILNRLNDNNMKVCNILEELNKKVERLSSDLETVKSYINKQEEIKKIKLQEEKNISNGWWFGY